MCVDASFQVTCSQWIAFTILTSRIISEAFLPSSIRDTKYFILHQHLNALILSASSGCKRDMVHLGRKINFTLVKLFWRTSGWQGPLPRKWITFLSSKRSFSSRSYPFGSMLCCSRSNARYLVLTLFCVFLKHLGDLLF